MDRHPPSPQTTLLLLLGASSWPLSPEFHSSEAFAAAARRVKAYFLNPYPFGLPQKNLLDLFNSEKTADEMDVMIGEFLEQRRAVLQAAGNPVRDLVVYFIGHGGFVGRDADFYLAIRRTRMDNPRASSLQVVALADTLTERARYLRRIIILDCCFAAAAFSAFQSGPAQVALEKTVDAFEVRQKAIGFPTKGTTLLCSSGHKSPSLVLPDESSTMFSKAFLDTLVQGTPFSQEYLTLRDVKDATADRLSEIRNAPRPVVLSPDQSEGDVADIPLFPNPWIEKQRLQKVEEERRRQEEEEHRLQVEEETRKAAEEQLRRAQEEAQLREIAEEQKRKVEEERVRRAETEVVTPQNQAVEGSTSVIPSFPAEEGPPKGSLSLEPVPALKKEGSTPPNQELPPTKPVGPLPRFQWEEIDSDSPVTPLSRSVGEVPPLPASSSRDVWSLDKKKIILLLVGTILCAGMYFIAIGTFYFSYINHSGQLSELFFAVLIIAWLICFTLAAISGPWVGLVVGGVGTILGGYLGEFYFFSGGYLGELDYFSTLEQRTVSYIWPLCIGNAAAGFIAGLTLPLTKGRYNTVRSFAIAGSLYVLGLCILGLCMLLTDIRLSIVSFVTLPLFLIILFIYDTLRQRRDASYE